VAAHKGKVTLYCAYNCEGLHICMGVDKAWGAANHSEYYNFVVCSFGLDFILLKEGCIVDLCY
jgi:hypothetical protein